MSEKMKKMISLCLSLCIVLIASAQTTGSTQSEVIKYKEKDGLIVVELIVNGTPADFLIDLSGQNTILAEYIEKLGIKETSPFVGLPPAGALKSGATMFAPVATLSLGNNVSANGLKVFVVPDKDDRLRSLGVAGTINGSLFKNCVLTINAKRKEITTSIPVRPAYMSLKNRANITYLGSSSAVTFPFLIDGKAVESLFDTSEKALLALPEGNTTVRSLQFINVPIPQPEAGTVNQKEQTVVGLGLLQHGILSVDYPHAKVYFQTYDETEVTEGPELELAAIVDGKLNEIGRAEFLEYIFDYRSGADFVLKGDKSVVVDFWASWCGPCMKMLPQMEKMAEKYKDKVIFYKVNADKEKELCARFNVQTLPTLLFIPRQGTPIVEVGAFPEKYTEIIEKRLLNVNE